MKTILFVCNENSARSQMAEAFFNHFNKNPKYIGASAGLKQTDEIKPFAVEVMRERGIDLSFQKPKILTFEMIEKAYRIYTMGCVKNCPLAPWEKTLEWKLEDPKEQPIDVFRKVRDDIEVRVKELILEFK